MYKNSELGISTLPISYSYGIDYLKMLIAKNDPIQGFYLAHLAYKIGVWLEENCTEYSFGFTYAPVNISVDEFTVFHIEEYVPSTSTIHTKQFINHFTDSVDIATKVYFKHEQDVLAFRLRWGL